MKFFIVAVLTFIGCAHSLTVTNTTGSTPPPCEIPEDFCIRKENGNFAHPSMPNYFITCSENQASCTPCWPTDLFFKQECNQCLYSLEDDCYTTKVWSPHTTYYCPPGLCEARGDQNLDKNIEDPNQAHHYIGCWKGMTRGCVVCPAYLKFNEPCNACLYRGLYITEDDIYRSKIIQLIDSPNCLSAKSESVAEFVQCDFGPTNDDNKRSKFYFDNNTGKIQNVYYHKCLKKSDSSNEYVLVDCGTGQNPVPGLDFTLSGDGLLKDSAGNCVGGGSTEFDKPIVDAGCGNKYISKPGEQ